MEDAEKMAAVLQEKSSEFEKRFVERMGRPYLQSYPEDRHCRHVDSYERSCGGWPLCHHLRTHDRGYLYYTKRNA